MFLSLVLTHSEFTFTTKAWRDLPRSHTIAPRMQWRTCISIWQTTASTRNQKPSLKTSQSLIETTATNGAWVLSNRTWKTWASICSPFGREFMIRLLSPLFRWSTISKQGLRKCKIQLDELVVLSYMGSILFWIAISSHIFWKLIFHLVWVLIHL